MALRCAALLVLLCATPAAGHAPLLGKMFVLQSAAKAEICVSPNGPIVESGVPSIYYDDASSCNTTDPNNQFRAIPAGDGFVLQSVGSSDYCIGASSMTDGVKLEYAECDLSNSLFQFKASLADDGVAFVLQFAASSSFCIQPEGGTTVSGVRQVVTEDATACSSPEDAEYQFRASYTQTFEPLPSEFVLQSMASSEQCVHPKEAVDDFAKLVYFEDPGSCWLNDTQTQFRALDAGDGAFVLQSLVTGDYCVGPATSSAISSGTTLAFISGAAGCNLTDTKLQFRALHAADGAFVLQSVADYNFCVSPRGGGTFSGTELILFDSCAVGNPQLQLTALPTGAAAPPPSVAPLPSLFGRTFVLQSTASSVQCVAPTVSVDDGTKLQYFEDPGGCWLNDTQTQFRALDAGDGAFVLQSAAGGDHCVNPSGALIGANVELAFMSGAAACNLTNPKLQFRALNAGNNAFVLQSVADDTYCIAPYGGTAASMVELAFIGNCALNNPQLQFTALNATVLPSPPPPPPLDSLFGRDFVLQSMASSMQCVSPAETVGTGIKLQYSEDPGGCWLNDTQTQFRALDAGDGAFVLQSAAGGDHCVNPSGALIGANVELAFMSGAAACNLTNPKLQFRALNAGDNAFVLQSVADDAYCIAPFGGTASSGKGLVFIGNCALNDPQFQLTALNSTVLPPPAPPPPFAPLPSLFGRNFVLQSMASSMQCVSPMHTTEHGVTLNYFADPGGCWLNDTQTHFRALDAGDGAFVLQSATLGASQCVHPYGSTVKANTELVFMSGTTACDLNNPQLQFRALNAGGGAFVLQSVADDSFCVTPEGGTVKSGSELVFMGSCAIDDPQLQLTAINATEIPPPTPFNLTLLPGFVLQSVADSDYCMTYYGGDVEVGDNMVLWPECRDNVTRNQLFAVEANDGAIMLRATTKTGEYCLIPDNGLVESGAELAFRQNAACDTTDSNLLFRTVAAYTTSLTSDGEFILQSAASPNYCLQPDGNLVDADVRFVFKTGDEGCSLFNPNSQFIALTARPLSFGPSPPSLPPPSPPLPPSPPGVKLEIDAILTPSTVDKGDAVGVDCTSFLSQAQDSSLPLLLQHYTIEFEFNGANATAPTSDFLSSRRGILIYGNAPEAADSNLGFLVHSASPRGGQYLRHYWFGNDLDVDTAAGDSVIDLYDGAWHKIRASWDGTTRATYVDDEVCRARRIDLMRPTGVVASVYSQYHSRFRLSPSQLKGSDTATRGSNLFTDVDMFCVGNAGADVRHFTIYNQDSLPPPPAPPEPPPLPILPPSPPGLQFEMRDPFILSHQDCKSYLSQAQASNLPLLLQHYTIEFAYKNPIPLDAGVANWRTFVFYGNDPAAADSNLGLLIGDATSGGGQTLRHYWWGNDLDVDSAAGDSVIDLYDGAWHTIRASWNGTVRATFVDDEVCRARRIDLARFPPTLLHARVLNRTLTFDSLFAAQGLR